VSENLQFVCLCQILVFLKDTISLKHIPFAMGKFFYEYWLASSYAACLKAPHKKNFFSNKSLVYRIVLQIYLDIGLGRIKICKLYHHKAQMNLCVGYLLTNKPIEKVA
jgi:hypothetical protein